jgi:mono/diheme cytochrome c family protein
MENERITNWKGTVHETHSVVCGMFDGFGRRGSRTRSGLSRVDEDCWSQPGNLRKNLEAKIGDAASADAKKLQEVFGQVYEFWHKKNVDDAAKFAMNARDGEQASAGKFDEASVTLKATSANCGGCHSARREGAGQFLEDQVILLSKLCVPERSLTVPMA